MTTNNNGLYSLIDGPSQSWQGPAESIAFDATGIQDRLLNLDKPCYAVEQQNQIGITNEGSLDHSKPAHSLKTLASSPPLSINQLGDPSFLATHGVKYAYAAGSMANAISGEELVIALGKEGILSSFGAGGLVPSRVEAAIHRIQQALFQGPWAFNLIHSPSEGALERNVVDLYLKHDVTTIEASAFLDLTPQVVHYRVAGLGLDAANQIQIKNRVIAKVSRREVATKFLQPAPVNILTSLVEQNLITELQATLAEKIPMADDITVEADSGGHTDNRPLVCLLPSIIALRDEIQDKYRYPEQVRIGAAGGIGTPTSALGAFMMGAAYVMTGSINQACVEAGTCEHTKTLLVQAEMTDVFMAPAADMFEMGVKLQVLKRGTFFPMRAQKLFDFYKTYDSIDEIPVSERQKLEKQIFKRDLESVWKDCVTFFNERDPDQIRRATNNPKRKMALIFRWYLGLASRWANSGEKGREMDYQIWCGPAMGAFNDWTRGSYLAESGNRRAVDVAQHIMTGAAFLYRLQDLKIQGLQIPAHYGQYCPVP
ncbi:MAG: PfaD family polyunsaturated fatty acid/polyketide biosynthesis protein [Chloroflexi bacterium]|nr:PfaD family polyunsaturated fatty acid/polyketide biosynthesis protein [Chloroflexota bacterium]